MNPFKALNPHQSFSFISMSSETAFQNFHFAYEWKFAFPWNKFFNIFLYHPHEYHSYDDTRYKLIPLKGYFWNTTSSQKKSDEYFNFPMHKGIK